MGRKKKVLKFVQIPNNMCSGEKYTPMDLYIYAGIRSYMNGQTGIAFPSMETLAKRLKCSKDTIMNSIHRMERDLFTVHKRKNVGWFGLRNVYQFPQLHGYEEINVELLWRRDLSIHEKAYILACCQYMFKDKKDTGKICYSTEDLAKLINLKPHTMLVYERSLIEKGILKKEKSKKLTESGNQIAETKRLFDLKALGQGFIWEREAQRRKEERERKRALQGKKMSLSQLQEESEKVTGLESLVFEAMKIGYGKVITDKNI